MFRSTICDDLIYEEKTKITNSQVSNTEWSKNEYTFTLEWKIQDIIPAILGTFWTIPIGKDVVYGWGEHILTTNDGGETATFRRYDM